MPDEILSKRLSNSLKGLAAILVLSAHCAQWYAAQTNVNMIIGLVAKLGRYGVSIFFAVSGYGLVCSAKKGIDRNFLKRRLTATYMPYIMIEGIALSLRGINWNLERLVRIFLGMDAWFVMVILLFYILFYLGWKYSKHKVRTIETGIFIISVLLAVIFKDSLWYSSNIAFGIGVLVKTYEKEFIAFVSKGWGNKIILLAVWFALSGFIYMSAMNRNQIIYILFKVMASGAWTVLILALCVKVNYKGELLERLGQISLECYLLYPHIFSVVDRMELPLTEKLIIGLLFVFGLSCLWHYTYGILVKRKVTES